MHLPIGDVSSLLLALGTLMAGFAALATLVLARKNRSQLTPSNGKTIAEIIENSNHIARATRRDIYRLAVALGEHLQHVDQTRTELGLPPEPPLTDPFTRPVDYPPGFDEFYRSRRETDSDFDDE